MADRMNVCRDGKPIYDIVMDTSFSGLKEEADRLSLKEHKICIVTDSNVAPLYLEEVKTILSGCCRQVSVFIFPAGEENKNLETVKKLYEHLILEHFDRKDILAALRALTKPRRGISEKSYACVLRMNGSKKKYLVRQNEDGQTEYVRLKMKSSK